MGVVVGVGVLMAAFVILHHQFPANHARENHWDLMLVDGEKLATWALSAEPKIGKTIAAKKLPPHRMDYLDYEGPISNDRGSVKQVQRGEYSGALDWHRAETGFEIELIFSGGRWYVWLHETKPDFWECKFTAAD